MELYSKQAEKNIIGAILVGNHKLLEVVNIDYFYTSNLKAIFKAIMDLKGKGIDADLATITKQLENNKTFNPLFEIMDIISHTLPTEIPANIKLLKDLYKRRVTINLLQKSIHQLGDINKEVDNINTSIASKIDSLTLDNDVKDDSTPNIIERLKEDLMSAQDNNEQYRYGIKELDNMTWGLHKEELTTIGAKSGVGKTAFALQIATTILLKGLKVLIVSREMSDIQIFKRILVSYTGIESNKFRSRAFTQKEWIRIKKEMDAIKNNIDLNVNTEISTITEIKRRVRQLKPDVLIVDYLQLLTPEKTEGSREREVATISREMKNITQDFKIPVIQLTQLNDQFGDSRPRGERAMRESKAIYQNSNNVIYIHKPEPKEIDEHIKKQKISIEELELISQGGNDVVEIILDKQRDGITGSFLQQFIKNRLKFAPLNEYQGEMPFD